VPVELVERGDTASIRGLGRLGSAVSDVSAEAFGGCESGELIAESSFTPSFHAGGEGT
jgi:hypothetical protein